MPPTGIPVAAKIYGDPMTDYPIDIVRSSRRKRTVSAGLRSGRLRVMVPDGLEAQEESKLVREVASRVERITTSVGVDLEARATHLADEYGLRAPEAIEWSQRQNRRWGSCTPGERRIRVSIRLALMPEWVLDWVLIHEMAHLEFADHGPGFQKLVGRYDMAERATGYLMAVSEHCTV